MMTWWEVAVRLGLAVVLGGAIGMERQTVEKPAGFRTHILVCLGAALFTLLSTQGFFGPNVDPSRVAANVVVGIGFLGAGTIWRTGTTVQGLTTAASLWTVAAIGMAVGIGFYFAAILGTGLVVVVLMLLKRLEVRMPRRGLNVLSLVIRDRPGQLGRIGTLLGAYNVNIEDVQITHMTNEKVGLTLAVRLPQRANRDQILMDLGGVDGIEEVRWEE
jgi:putative Mg2+ transporter-C (MgtC) family protein